MSNVDAFLERLIERGCTQRYRFEFLEDDRRSAAEIVNALSLGPFHDPYVLDKTDVWYRWTTERALRFRGRRDFFRTLYGRDIFEARCKFYDDVAESFERNQLRGVTISSAAISEDVWDLESVSIIEFDNV